VVSRSNLPARRRAALALALAAGAAAGACSDDRHGGGGAADASAADDAAADCWPIDTSTPEGIIEIGTGTGGFEPMPDTLPFIAGTQGGTFLIVHSRIKGLEPGNPDDFLEPTNPKTKFSAIMFDGTEVTRECPGTVGYQPSAEEGYFERQRFQNLEFLPFELGERAFDTDMTVIVEVIDVNGHYARDERHIFASAPEGWPYDPPDAAPAGDGGAADAGPPDAGAADAD